MNSEKFQVLTCSASNRETAINNAFAESRANTGALTISAKTFAFLLII